MSLVENLTYKKGDFFLQIPRWEIQDHGITVLSGASGSGKSTLFKILLGLIPCPGMSWTFQGIDLAKLSVRERRLGVVFQNYDLFPHLSARGNLLFAAEARKVEAKETKILLDRLSTTLKMEKFLDRKVSLCSGGEKQRVALARAFIGKPRWLLLDEPFSALDEELREEARQLVKTSIEAFSIPTILVTHDLRDAQSLGDQQFKIKDGHLIHENFQEKS